MAEYIEREQLIRELKDVIADYKDEHIFSTDFAATIVTDMLDYIVKCQPAADVAPVRHGRWVQVIVHVEFKDGFVDRVEECCSACHEPNGSDARIFCPNCGAKMDLEE